MIIEQEEDLRAEQAGKRPRHAPALGSMRVGQSLAFAIVSRGGAIQTVGEVAGGAVNAGGRAFKLLTTRRPDRLPEGVLVIEESMASGMITPGGVPRLHTLYVLHSVDPRRYVPYAAAPHEMLRDRAAEAERFFLACGASRIDLTVESGEEIDRSGGASYREPRWGGSVKAAMNRRRKTARTATIEAPGFAKPRPYVPEEWMWAPHESEWLELRRKREEYAVTTAELSMVQEDERELSAEVAAEIMKSAKISLGGQQRDFKSTKWTWSVAFPT